MIFIAFIALFVMLILAMIFRYAFVDMDKNKAEVQTVDDLRLQLGEVLKKQRELDVRLTNIEHIVTDDRFAHPLEPRESIHLKKEMDELKILIEKIAKR